MSLTNKTIDGFFWSFVEKFGTQLLQVIIFIVLARVLTPKAFGLMGMMAIFVQFSQSIVDSGFGQALIQKKDTDEIDYSSVFYLNLLISACVYSILYFSAPLIADFYDAQELIKLVRVFGLQFIISAFSLVQIARLTKEVRFRELMLVKLPSTFLGGVAGVAAAYSGLGIWSLIIHQLTDKIAYSIQVWFHSKWKPALVFKWERVKLLFDFGGKLMLEGLLSTVYRNLYELAIGRYFSAAQVGYYTQANRLKDLPVQNISISLERVTFSVLSDIQDDDYRLKRAFQKIIRQVSFLLAPVMIGGIVLAEPLFRFVLTEQWLPAVPYFQVLCISGLFYPLSVYNLNILKVKGRSDLYLYLGVVKKGVAIVAIFILVQYSVMALVIYNAVHIILSFFINSYFCGKQINYKTFEQIKDVWIFLVISSFSGIITYYFLEQLGLDDIGTILIGLLMGSGIYGVLIYFFEKPILKYSRETIKSFNKI